MPTTTQDLAFVRAGVDELEAYLLSDVLYWPLSGPSSLPRLTLGGLLLSLMRLRVRLNSPAEVAQVTGLENRLEAARTKWRSSWERKCRREVHARLGLWRDYLADVCQSTESQAESYPEQVKGRVLLQIMKHELEDPSGEIEILAELDKMVKSAWLPGGFVWEPDLAAAFPEPEYWFLYGRLKS
jgi:hypothetical protein